MITPFLFREIPVFFQYVLMGIMAVSLLLAWRWRWRDYLLPWKINRRLFQNQNALAKKTSQPAEELELSAFARPLPRVSVVIPCCNQADALRKNLPAIWEQDLDAFEVIIADEASTDETRELVNHLAIEHPNLRYTFVPSSSRYVDRRKLAITLGFRAAKAPWVILTEADCRPADASWLRLISSRLSDESDFVLGYANYVNDGSRQARRSIFERLRSQLVRYRAAVGTRRLWSRLYGAPSGKAFGGDLANMAVRKSWFLENKGYAESLTVSCGADDLLVDALSRKGRTVVETRPEATVLQSMQPRPILRAQRTAHRETLCRLSRRGTLFRYRESAASWMVWIFFLAFLCYLGLRLAVVVQSQEYNINNVAGDASVLLLAILNICLPGWFLRKGVDSLGERRFCWIGLSLRYLMQPFLTLSGKMAHFKQRHDFVRR